MSHRAAAYRAALAEAGADAFVLVSEPAVAHATGVRLWTQRLIPQRPVAAVIQADHEEPTLVVCALEQDQLAHEHPELELRPFREFGDDPWVRVAAALPPAVRVIVENEMPAAWLRSLVAALPRARIEVSYELPLRPRMVKDAGEQALLREASRQAEHALAAGAALCEPDRPERDVAAAIVSSFLAAFGERATEVLAFCVGPKNNRSMHHVSRGDPLPAAGPVRLGIVGRVDWYWVLICRMIALGDDEHFEEAYGRYLGVYLDTLALLQPGAEAGDLWRECHARAAQSGFDLRTLKIGHGTGLDFRERPWLSEHESERLGPGMVLAYDYGLEDAHGTVLHVEDRVLVTERGPVRLSDVWDLAALRFAQPAAVAPPSATSAEPVTKLDSSEARNSTQ